MSSNRYSTIAGLALIFAALVVNPLSVASVLSPDGEIDSIAIRHLIMLAEILVFIPGVFIFAHPRSTAATAALARRFPRSAATFFGLAAALFIAGAIIAVAEIVLRMSPAEPNLNTSRAQYVAKLFQPDPLLGYRARPNTQARSRWFHEGELMYDVTYTTDESGRRVSPLMQSAAPAQFALFFGGSFAFGEGLRDDETVAVQFGNRRPEFRPYNVGFSGYGPQQMCVQLGQADFVDSITESKGILIYTFIDDHINRAIGAMDVINNGGQDFPYYAIEQEQAVHRGAFARARPYTTLLYTILGKSRAVRALNIRLPLRRTDEHFERTAQIIIEANRVFNNRYPASEFYVMIFPGAEEGIRIASMLENAGLGILNYSNLFSTHQNETDALFYEDGHPTARACAIIAEELALDIAVGPKL